MQRNSILQIWRMTTSNITNVVPPTPLSIISSTISSSSSSFSSSSFVPRSLSSNSFTLPSTTLSSSSRAYIHTTTILQRGSKNLDWYRNALRRIEQEKNRINPPIFPTTETLHGKPRQRMVLEFQIGKESDNNIQKIIIELADDIVPLTVSNFVKLCQNPVGQGYKGSEIFRIQKNFALFMGDYKLNNGHGNCSSFPSTYFPDENFIGRHTKPGVLGMANSGVHTNGSIFYITTTAATHLDGRNVVFGRVLDGMDIIKKFDSVLTVNLKPTTPITIKSCTEILPESKEWKQVDAKLKTLETPTNKPNTTTTNTNKDTTGDKKANAASKPAETKTTPKK